MKTTHVLGIMSGTSLDGIDIADIYFSYSNKWNFKLGHCETIPYPQQWVEKLKKSHTLSIPELELVNKEYTEYLAQVINTFILKNKISNLDAVCSHGHTVLHEPQNKYTLQIGNLPRLAKLIQQKVVCDFRVQDVLLGGQGAPLVPIGDQLLFSNYDFCLNLGGFANISFLHNNNRIAFDNCPVNTVLNQYAEKLDAPYDYNGDFARQGVLNTKLLEKLNHLPYYKKQPPKSLGIEWVSNHITPILNQYSIPPKDILHTFTTHVAQCISKDIIRYTTKTDYNILITGGGAYNGFLIEILQKNIKVPIILPHPNIIEFKEALIFGLLGVLKLNNQINTLSSVTGANQNHSSGNVFNY